MPEITLGHVVMLAVAVIVGLAVGWVFRGNRGESEKAAINAGWQEQIEAQRNEHQRLLEQNKSLMEQNSQYQASNRDSKQRATELSAALKEAIARRDELQRQIKDIRGNLETAVRQREQLQTDMANRNAEVDVTSVALQRRDEKIARLTKELEGWQERVPPIIERFRTRNAEALELEQELEAARERIDSLEAMLGSDQTRVEPVDREALGEHIDASNEPLEEEAAALPDAAAEPADEQPGLYGEAGEEGSGDAAAGFAGDDDGLDADVQAGDRPDDEIVVEAEAAEWFAADEGGEAAADESESEAIAAAESAGAPSADDQATDTDDMDAKADAHHHDADDDIGANAPDDDSVQPEPALNGGGRDDLKMIKGVGPAIEKTLNEMGIWRFQQVAEMGEYDIDRIARRLKGFRSRIYREDWIGQARELRDQQSIAHSN